MAARHRALAVGTGVIVIVAVAALGAWMWPRLFPSRLERARAAYEQRDWRTAAALAREIRQERPGDVEALRLLARTHGRMGRDETAQQLFSRVDDQAMQAEDLFLLGAGLVRQDQAGPAMAVLEKARKLDPFHAETLHELARLYARLNRLGDAVEVASGLAAVPGWEARGGVILGALCQERLDPAGASDALDPRLACRPAVARRGGFSFHGPQASRPHFAPDSSTRPCQGSPRDCSDRRARLRSVVALEPGVLTLWRRRTGGSSSDRSRGIRPG